MKNFAYFCLSCMVLCVVFLSGCSMNASQMVSRRLDPEDMNSKLETQTMDLSVDGKCPETKSVRVVNGESRTDEYCINNVMGGCRWYIIPKDFTNEIVKYVENRLSASHIKVGSGNDIIVSLEELKSQEGVWSFGSICKIKIQILETNYTQTYVGESGSGLGDLAAAYQPVEKALFCKPVNHRRRPLRNPAEVFCSAADGEPRASAAQKWS